MAETPAGNTSHSENGIDKRGGTPQIFTLTLTNADEDYTLTLPQGSSIFNLQNRNANDLKIGDAEGEIAADRYFTLKAGHVLFESGLRLNQANTLVIQTANAGDIVEVIVWQ